jgi:CheY-like chemotaxis protein
MDEAKRARGDEVILVVEDDEDVRHYTVSSLRELGYRVFEAVDALSALTIFQRESRIDLLFTDLGLPGDMDGKALTERIHAIRPSTTVLITTAYAGSVLIHEGRLSPRVELLSKPFTFVALAGRIRDLLDRQSADPDRTSVLVVDDEVLLRMLVVETLEQRGLHTEEAGSFNEALEKIQRAGDGLAAAIIDIGLPDKAGDGLVASLRALRPNLPVILTTGYAREDMHRTFAGQTFLEILEKPFEPEILIGLLARFGVHARTGNSTG